MSGFDLDVEHLTVRFGTGRRAFTALDDISFTLPAGEVLGVVGPSGSGKSTLAACLVGALRPAAGRIVIAGQVLTGRRLDFARRRAVQWIPQNPDTSLDPRASIGATLAEAAAPRARDRRPRAADLVGLLDEVGLPADVLGAYPFELSGGQRQRVAIARALAAAPKLIVADEITSALDASLRNDTLLLLEQHRARHGTTVVHIAHDLEIVRQLCSQVLSLEQGRVVGAGAGSEIMRPTRR